MTGATGGAFLSDCGRYRYTLHRRWAREGEEPRRLARPGDDLLDDMVAFVGLNPSTADAEQDDPTVRRCVGFARAWGFAGVVLVNLFAWRATDPRELPLAYLGTDDAIGPANDAVLREVCGRAALVVAAWGSHSLPREAAREVADRVRWVEREGLLGDPAVLGLTKDGSPRHPLYMPAATWPVRPHPDREHMMRMTGVRVPAS